MPSIRRVITTSADGHITIQSSDAAGFCEIRTSTTESSEEQLIATVVEYGRERGILPKMRLKKDLRPPRKMRNKRKAVPPEAVAALPFEEPVVNAAILGSDEPPPGDEPPPDAA